MKLRYISFCVLIALLSFIGFGTLDAQNFGNEWIDYSKTYYKIPINAEGIYRISYDQLANAGVPIATNMPQQIQLFFRGKEIAIRVVGEEDSVFNRTDFVEFYGRANRTDLMQEMYDKPENITRTEDDEYQGTAFYFLTFAQRGVKGKRMSDFYENNPAISPEIYHTQVLIGDKASWRTGFFSGPLFPVNFNGLDEKGALFSHFTVGKGQGSFEYSPNSGKINLGYTLIDPKVTEARAEKVEPRLYMKVLGRTNTTHNVDIFAGIHPDSQRVAVANPQFENRTMRIVDTRLPEMAFPARNGSFFVSLRVKTTTTNPASEVIFLGTIEIYYPQGFDMQGAGQRNFLLNAKSTGKSKIRLTNAAANTRIFDITDESNLIAIRTDNAGNTMTGTVAGTNQARKLLAISAISTIPQGITPINFKPISLSGSPDYLIITDERLMQPAGGVPNPVQAYADYRTSTQGGSYRPLVVTFQQLCDLFTYGEQTPLAMRRFVNFMQRNGNPKFLYLMGKGLHIGFYYFYNPIAYTEYRNLVPPWGYPSSDHEISAGQNGFPLHIPSLATGRIAADKPIDVINYLNKVKEYEADAFDAPWKKEILHLSGGYDLNQNNTFRAYTDGFARIAQGDFLGANVETLSKKTTDYIEFIDITQQINAGKGIITFFGHSSAENTDIDVGRASEPRLGFRNKGKYPFMIVNGCGSGNAFLRGASIGEDWVLTPDKGAIGFLAHSHIGLDGPLRIYTQTLYETWFSQKGMLNKPIGIVMQEFLKSYRNRFPDELALANTQQIVLQADPALVLFKSTLPDYSITENDQQLFIRPLGNRSLTAQSDSFRIGIPVKNLGITDEKRFQVGVKRTYPDGTIETLRAIRHSRKVTYLDTVYYTVVNPKEGRDRINGNNSFEVTIDPSFEISEMRRENNVATLSFFFRKGSLINIAPKEFSIVSKQPVTFIAQNTDAFTRERLYRFQLDTAHTFNSPALRDTVVYGYITPFWTTNLLADNQAHDSTVYYWRARYAQLTPDDDPAWADASFVYIKNSPDGWSQSKTPQFPKNTLERVEPNLQTRKWNFTDNVLNIQARAIGGNSPNWAAWNLTINGQAIATSANCAVDQMPARGCANTTNKIIMVSIDGETGKVYREFFFDQVDPCGANLLVSSLEQCFLIRFGNLMDEYLKKVKTGDYVILMNSRFVGNIGSSNIAALSKIGVRTSNLDNRGLNTAAFIIIGQKGAPVGSALERYGADAFQEINVATTLRRPSRSGQVTSTLIGPAAEWGNTFRLINNAENPTRESWKLDVIGVDFNGREQLVRENVRQDGLSLKDLNPATFPYIKLRLNVIDSLNRTPYQLQRWQVIYKEVPEGILLYDTLSYRENTLLEIVEGDSIKIGFNFLNISGNDFKEPLTVQYDIVNIPTGRRTRLTQNITAPKRNQTTYFKTNLYSLNFIGENRMTVFVNPRLQAEQIYENNQLEVRFKVKEDDINPVLDVAVDGRHIMDGEIVSPMPMISIGLTDENKYLVRRDTTGMEIFLARDCATCKPQRIYMNNPNLIWTIVPEKNKIQIEYRSERLENGTYKLSVQGRDSRNNKAGAQPFSVTFKVINETKISNFYPYPNPFTTNMKFVFTLTGEVPDDIRIQIMTVTGKVVRTIHKDELGALRVGDNLSEFSWDGTDQFGDQLARGVYLFKVDVRKQGKDFERFETAGDGLFEKGFGKIYLMR